MGKRKRKRKDITTEPTFDGEGNGTVFVRGLLDNRINCFRRIEDCERDIKKDWEQDEFFKKED